MNTLGTRRVIVTGATSGIGFEIARQLLAAGSFVSMIGRNVNKVRCLEKQYPGKAMVLECDFLQREMSADLVGRAYEQMGGLDGLVHCAGVIRHCSLDEVSEQDLSEQMEINLLAPIRLTQQAMPLIEEGGAILFLSSTLSPRPIPTSAIYSTTKGGLDAFMRAVAVEGAPKRIRSNSLVLGMVDTPMLRVDRPGSRDENEFKLESSKLHLLGSLGEVEGVAQVALEILGRPWMTGSQTILDGGLLLQG